MDNKFDGFRAFRGLPITREQDAEIRRYIARCEAEGRSWDRLELDYMIKDMLYPTPADERYDVCEKYARNLAMQIHRTDEPLDGYLQKIPSTDRDTFTELEWKWIVHEAGRRA